MCGAEVSVEPRNLRVSRASRCSSSAWLEEREAAGVRLLCDSFGGCVKEWGSWISHEQRLPRESGGRVEAELWELGEGGACMRRVLVLLIVVPSLPHPLGELRKGQCVGVQRAGR